MLHFLLIKFDSLYVFSEYACRKHIRINDYKTAPYHPYNSTNNAKRFEISIKNGHPIEKR